MRRLLVGSVRAAAVGSNDASRAYRRGVPPGCCASASSEAETSGKRPGTDSASTTDRR
jgi:hypothetical protein